MSPNADADRKKKLAAARRKRNLDQVIANLADLAGTALLRGRSRREVARRVGLSELPVRRLAAGHCPGLGPLRRLLMTMEDRPLVLLELNVRILERWRGQSLNVLTYSDAGVDVRAELDAVPSLASLIHALRKRGRRRKGKPPGPARVGWERRFESRIRRGPFPTWRGLRRFLNGFHESERMEALVHLAYGFSLFIDNTSTARRTLLSRLGTRAVDPTVCPRLYDIVVCAHPTKHLQALGIAQTRTQESPPSASESAPALKSLKQPSKAPPATPVPVVLARMPDTSDRPGISPPMW